MKARLLAMICISVFSLMSITANAIQQGCSSYPAASCNVNSGMKICSAAVTCVGSYTNLDGPQAVGVYWTLFPASPTANVTGCSQTATTATGPSVMFNLMASALTTAPASRQCVWGWNSSYPAISGKQALSGTITINAASGLPVELMEFSLE